MKKNMLKLCCCLAGKQYNTMDINYLDLSSFALKEYGTIEFRKGKIFTSRRKESFNIVNNDAGAGLPLNAKTF